MITAEKRQSISHLLTPQDERYDDLIVKVADAQFAVEQIRAVLPNRNPAKS